MLSYRGHPSGELEQGDIVSRQSSVAGDSVILGGSESSVSCLLKVCDAFDGGKEGTTVLISTYQVWFYMRVP